MLHAAMREAPTPAITSNHQLHTAVTHMIFIALAVLRLPACRLPTGKVTPEPLATVAPAATASAATAYESPTNPLMADTEATPDHHLTSSPSNPEEMSLQDKRHFFEAEVARHSVTSTKGNNKVSPRAASVAAGHGKSLKV